MAMVHVYVFYALYIYFSHNPLIILHVGEAGSEKKGRTTFLNFFVTKSCRYHSHPPSLTCSSSWFPCAVSCLLPNNHISYSTVVVNMSSGFDDLIWYYMLDYCLTSCEIACLDVPCMYCNWRWWTELPLGIICHILTFRSQLLPNAFWALILDAYLAAFLSPLMIIVLQRTRC